MVEEAVLDRLGPRARRRARHRRREPHRDRRARKEPDRSASLFTLGPRVLLSTREPRRDGPGPTRQPRPLPHPRAPAGRARAARGARRSLAAGDRRSRRARHDLRRGAARATPLLRPAHDLPSAWSGSPACSSAVSASRPRCARSSRGRSPTIAILRVPRRERADADGRVPGPDAGARRPREPRGRGPRHGRPARCSGRSSPPFVPFELEARSDPGTVATGLLAGLPGDAPLRALAAPLGPRGSAGDPAAPPGRRGPRAARAGRGRLPLPCRAGWPRSRSGRRARCGSARSSSARRRARCCFSPSPRGRRAGSPDGSRGRARSPGVRASHALDPARGARRSA